MSFSIDLDKDAVQLDGTWYTRDELARRIKSMLDGGDFSVARPSQALEKLNAALADARTLAFRASPELVESLNAEATRQGKTIAAIIREAVQAHLVRPDLRPIPLETPVAPSRPAPVSPAPVVQASPQRTAEPSDAVGGVHLPSVVVDARALSAKAGAVDEVGKSVELKSGKDEDDVERRWFGS